MVKITQITPANSNKTLDLIFLSIIPAVFKLFKKDINQPWLDDIRKVSAEAVNNKNYNLLLDYIKNNTKEEEFINKIQLTLAENRGLRTVLKAIAPVVHNGGWTSGYQGLVNDIIATLRYVYKAKDSQEFLEFYESKILPNFKSDGIPKAFAIYQSFFGKK